MQITSGRGPAECCRVVALVLEKILKQAAAKGVKTEVVERETGPLNRTLLSAVISLQGGDYHALIEDWEGSVQWIAQSPYPYRNERGSFRPTLAMAKQKTGYRTPAVETGIMEHRASHDSGTGQLE